MQSTVPDVPSSFVAAGDPSQLLGEVRAAFAEVYDTSPTQVARAPGRVNLIGEHTDYNRGLVLPVALPHATYAALAPREDDRVRIASREQDEPWTGTLDTLASASGWASYAAGALWALRESGVDLPGLDLLVHGTVPLGAGLSSSAALECSVAVGAVALTGAELDRQAVIEACIRAETEVAGAPTGGMDQTVSMRAADGAALLIDFDSGESRAVPLDLAADGLALLVTDTRVSHALVDGGYAERRDDCERAASLLGLESLRVATLEQVAGIEDDRTRRRAAHVVSEIARVTDAVAAVEARDWPALGSLFAASHVSMRDDFEISCAELDLAVDTAVEAGAIGARMTGGGFGGSSISLVPAERVDAVARAIDIAFAAAGFRSPAHLLAPPSAAASLVG